jgi:hypothetical protein
MKVLHGNKKNRENYTKPKPPKQQLVITLNCTKAMDKNDYNKLKEIFHKKKIENLVLDSDNFPVPKMPRPQSVHFTKL